MTTKTQREEALELVSETFVVTKEVDEVKDAFDDLMRLGKKAGGLCLSVLGESGVGKTTLILWLTKALHVERTADGWLRRKLGIEVPTAPTAISVLEALLEGLGDPRPSHGTRSQKMRRVVKILKDQKVELLILDDLQHMYDRESQRILFDASEAIKEILLKNPMCVLCAGLEDADRVVRSNEQLQRRNMRSLHLCRFDWSKGASRKEFIALIAAFSGKLGCYDIPDLAHESVALRLYLATGGIMDFVFKLFLAVAKIALDRNLSAVGLDVFEKAWKRSLFHAGDGDNPFQAKLDTDDEIVHWVARAKKINEPTSHVRRGSRKADEHLKRAGL